MIQNTLCTISSFLDVLLKVLGVSLTDAITKQELEHHEPNNPACHFAHLSK